jgi:isoprenylcysteine carboxyl methyltransferase (ICMT) family protein YpbQ
VGFRARRRRVGARALPRHGRAAHRPPDRRVRRGRRARSAVPARLLCQAARIWILVSLGRQWNTRVIVVPGLDRVRRGPYRYSWLPHPNYLIVVIEGIALPLVHTAWVTAIVFTVLNAVLLIGFRIPAEDRALKALSA